MASESFCFLITRLRINTKERPASKAKLPTATPTAIPAFEAVVRPLLDVEEDVLVADAELEAEDTKGSSDAPVTVVLKQETSVVKALVSTKVCESMLDGAVRAYHTTNVKYVQYQRTRRKSRTHCRYTGQYTRVGS